MTDMWLFETNSLWECEGEQKKCAFEALPPFAQRRVAALKVAEYGTFISGCGIKYFPSISGRTLFAVEVTANEMKKIRRIFR